MAEVAHGTISCAITLYYLAACVMSSQIHLDKMPYHGSSTSLDELPFKKQRRKAASLRGFALAQLTFQTLGIVYSDLSTSPLYTLNGIWPSNGPVPSERDIIGGVSAIIWSLTLLPLFKYVLISLYFGTYEGEGGTFALFQGLYASEASSSDISDVESQVTPDTQKNRPTLSPKLRWPLLIWCLFGTSLTIADGIFTPAVSVTSAVQGIAVAKPLVYNDVIPISIAILFFLFISQSFGTAKLALIFSPVASLWLALLAATGIYNITQYPAILRAFNPVEAILMFVRTKDFDLLAGILLALTGCEAMFANLGQFNALSIRISFTTIVYPSLLLAYLGQGARLIKDGQSVLENIFYRTIPGPVNGPLYWIVFVVAILATIIASQTLITATFSLFQQLIQSSSLPPLRMIYTSDTLYGQVYVPAVNYALMILTIIVVAGFKSSVALTNAFGFAVATVMFSTSVLIAIHIRYVKGLPLIVAFAYFVTFGFLDGLFWGAALKKVPDGAWVPLTIGLVLTSFMVFWAWAKGKEDAFDRSKRISWAEFTVLLRRGPRRHGLEIERLSTQSNDENIFDVTGTRVSEEVVPEPIASIALSSYSPIINHGYARIPCCAVFHRTANREARNVPHSFVGFLRQWPALPEIVLFVSSNTIPYPHMSWKDRYHVQKIDGLQGFYEVTYYLGYRDDYNIKMSEILKRVCEVERIADPAHADERIEIIQESARTSTHIVPHYHITHRHSADGRILTKVSNWWKALLLDGVYQRLVNMFPPSSNWNTPIEEMIHIGVTAAV